MADMAAATSSESVPPTNESDFSAPTRIKRNTACVRCRDAKVKCNASLNPNRPCLRCSKLDLDCVVDKGHKRTSRRSKLEELAAEVRNIKEAVVAGPSSAISPPTVPPPLRPEQLPSPHVRHQSYLNSVINPPYSSLPFASRPMSTDQLSPLNSQPQPTTQIAQPRALASKVFSGEDIDYYFGKYFEHFHPYMPIVRQRDPDACYTAAPILFWAIIVTACRRYAKHESTFKSLVDSISSEIWSAVALVPVRPPVINALLILATWSSPTIRFTSDPAYLYVGIALSSCLYLGVHTGKGSNIEFGVPRYQIATTDEEATYTWAASNIISQRISSYMGYPCTAPFNGNALGMIIDGTSPYSVPRSFAVNLQATKFSNRLLKTVSAGLENSPGISHHLVEQMEDEFLTLQRSVHDGTPDIDDFTLRSTLLDVQAMYWMPLPGCSEEALQRNLLRAYRTSESLIKLAGDLERTVGFLTHAPHYVFRSLALAACTIILFLRTPFPNPNLIPASEGDLLVHDAMTALRACSVQEDDLCIRAPNLMEAYWSVKDRLPPWDISQLRTATFRHRLGVSILYDCLGRWKRDVQSTRAAASNQVSAGVASGPASNDTVQPTGPNTDLGLADPLFQRIDWGSFMDDFEWNFPPGSMDLDRPAVGQL